MNADSAPFRVRRRDIAKVVVIGLAQVATLVAFLLLTIGIVDGLTSDRVVDPAELAAPTTPTQVWNTTLTHLGWLAGTALLHGGLRAVEFSVSEKIGYDVVRGLRMRMYAHLQGMTPREFQGRARGGLLLRFVGDLSMLRTWISRGLLGGLVALIALAGTVTVLIVLNPWLGLAIVTVLSGGAAASLGSGRAMRAATSSMRRRRSLVMSNIDEQMTALPVVQVFGRSGGEYARLSRQNDSLNRGLFRMAELRGRLRGIASASGLLAVVAVLAVGLVEVRRGTASVGLVVACIVATRQLNAPVRTLGLAHDYWHRAQVSEAKVLDFLHSSSRGLEAPGLARLRVRRGRIEFRGVSVPGALTGISLTAEPGQLVAVTGPSGAGKSTLLGLVARLVDPACGQVLIDGQVLASTAPRSIYRHVGIVSPDLPLMRGTVRRNLTYGVPGATAEEIQRVVLAIGLDDVLAHLPDGLDAWVTERGGNLSTGQRQRIALGRAMLGNPPILLLDEPTANLDPASRQFFREVLLRHQGTVLLVTHDPDELAMADQVWVLERGTVTQQVSGDGYRDGLWTRDRRSARWPRTA
jgi:ATP-binding cassette, subfamily B, bacterial